MVGLKSQFYLINHCILTYFVVINFWCVFWFIIELFPIYCKWCIYLIAVCLYGFRQLCIFSSSSSAELYPTICRETWRRNIMDFFQEFLLFFFILAVRRPLLRIGLPQCGHIRREVKYVGSVKRALFSFLFRGRVLLTL